MIRHATGGKWSKKKRFLHSGIILLVTPPYRFPFLLQMTERINKHFCLLHSIDLQKPCIGDGNISPGSHVHQKRALGSIRTEDISPIGADAAMPAGNMRLDLKRVLNLPDR